MWGATVRWRPWEYAMEHGKTIFLATQREAKVDDPREGDIYQVGTLSTVLQLPAFARRHG